MSTLWPAPPPILTMLSTRQRARPPHERHGFWTVFSGPNFTPRQVGHVATPWPPQTLHFRTGIPLHVEQAVGALVVAGVLV